MNELQAMYEELGYKPRKQTEYGVSEVEDIIWEVRRPPAALHAMLLPF